MFDVVYALVAVVCVEVAVISAGLFWYLPRVIGRAFVDAEKMIVRQREQTMEAAAGFIEDILTAENIQRLAEVAAPVLGEHLKRAAGGIVGAKLRRGGGDLMGDIGSALIQRFMGGEAPAAPEIMGGEGVAPPK